MMMIWKSSSLHPFWIYFILVLLFSLVPSVIGQNRQRRVHEDKNENGTTNLDDDDEKSTSSTSRPNILLLLTDDQDVVLGSFDYMPKLKYYLQENGMTFENYFVHTPVCCPSRSTMLTGRYLHNINVRNNSVTGNCYGEEWKATIEPFYTYALHAHDAGYTTAYAGKYLNQYGYGDSKDVPDGWDNFLGLVGNSRYYNQTLIDGGIGKEPIIHTYGDTYDTDYLPNVIRNRTMEWIKKLPEPWLIVVSWPTPHAPFTPAPWAVGTMKDYYAPNSTQDYNASKIYMEQKHWLMRQLYPITTNIAKDINTFYQRRLEALKSVDEHIEDFVTLLNYQRQLDKTVIMYTSDNGFQFGQHRLAIDKRHLYEHDIRVPFVISGPNILPGSTSTKLIGTVDIAPTIVDIVRPSDKQNILQNEMDGTSIWNYVRDRKRSNKHGNHNVNAVDDDDDDDYYYYLNHRNDMLISYNGEGSNGCGMTSCPIPRDHVWYMPDSFNNTYRCIRTIIGSTTKHDDDSTNDKTEKGKNKRQQNQEHDNGNDNENSIYCQFDDDEMFVEYYDLNKNPYQLTNDYYQLTTIQKQRYEYRLRQLIHCHGTTCRQTF